MPVYDEEDRNGGERIPTFRHIDDGKPNSYPRFRHTTDDKSMDELWREANEATERFLNELEGGTSSQPDRGASLTPGDLEKAESSGAARAPAASSEGSSTPFSYKGEGKGKKRGLLGKKLAIPAVGVSALLIGLIVLLIYLGSLLIPNFATHILAYQFARVTRETVSTNSKLTGQKIAIDSASDSVYQQAAARYKNLKNGTWDKINNYRPKKIVDRLQSTGQLDFQYSDPKGVLKRQTLQRIVIEGKAIDIPQNAVSRLDRITSPIDYIRSVFQANRDIKLSVNEALRGRNFIVRAKVAKQIRAKINVRLFAWSKEELKRYKGTTPANADVMNTKQSYRAATSNGASARKAAAGSSSDDVNKAQQQASAAMEQCVANDDCIKQVIQQARSGNGAVPATVAASLVEFFDNAKLNSFLSVASPSYAIAVPLCLVYDGSITNSQGVIDANSEEAQRSFYRVASAADQQKAGETNGEAVGAMSRQLGQIGRSNAEKRASGAPVDTVSTTVGAQASAGGSYSADIFNTFLPSGAASVISGVASPLCSVMTSPWTGVALVAANLLPGVGTALQGAGQITMRAIGGVLARQLLQVTRQFFAKKNLGQLALVTGATAAGTLLAKILVIQHMGAANNGLAQGEDYANQADNGGNLAGNELERGQNYGVPLSSEQVNQLKPLDVAFMHQEKQSESVYKRYFALTHPGSVANEAAVDLASTMNAGGLASLVNNTIGMLNPYNLFAKLFTPFQRPEIVAAAGPNVSDYNNVQWAWTPEEEDNFENNPVYQLLPNQEALDLSGKEEEIAGKYRKCYTDTMGTLLAGSDGGSPSIFRSESGEIITDQGDCSPQSLGMRNPAYGDLVYRWRVAMRYSNGLDNLLDGQGT